MLNRFIYALITTENKNQTMNKTCRLRDEGIVLRADIDEAKNLDLHIMLLHLIHVAAAQI